jgi:hypothetical protein
MCLSWCHRAEAGEDGLSRRIVQMENPAHEEPGGVCDNYDAWTSVLLPGRTAKSPAIRTNVSADLAGELVIPQVRGRQAGPPVPSGAGLRVAAQIAGQVVA